MYLLAVCSILWKGKMSLNWNESPFSFTPCVEKIQSTPNWQYFEMFMDSNLPLENLSKVPQCFRNIATLLKMNLLYIASDWVSDQQVEGLLGQSIRRTRGQLLSVVALDP